MVGVTIHKVYTDDSGETDMKRFYVGVFHMR